MNQADFTQRIAELETELEEMTAALAQAWDQLVPFLQDIPQQATGSLHDMLPVLEAAMTAMEAPVGAIYLKAGQECLTLPLDLVLQDALVKRLDIPLYSSTNVTLEQVPVWHLDNPTRWVLVPMVIGTDVVGMLGVGFEGNNHSHTSYEQRLLYRMAERATSQLVAADLEQSRQREARLAQELQIASLIQQSIQPTDTPSFDVLDLASLWRPARSVGGDAWGWVLRGDILSTFVLDVSGKGLPAALAAVSLHTAVTLALRLGMTPDVAIHTMNDQFYDAYTNAGIFATLCVISIDLNNGIMLHGNAGHTPTLVRTLDGWQHLQASVPPIGVLPDFNMTCDTVELQPDDTLIVYSDGFTEIETVDGWWGEAGMIGALPQQSVSAQDNLDAIVKQAEYVQGDDTLRDDQTIVIAVWKG